MSEERAVSGVQADGSPRRGAFTRKRPAAPTPKPLFPATKVITTGGIKVGFIGLTLEGTPSIVTPSGVAGLRFLDEADTANRYAAELKRQGVNTIVVLIHEGGLQTGGLSDCTGMSGAIIDIANRMSSDIDVVVSGHTHTFYICTIGTKLVTSASSFGRAVTDIDLTVESTNGEVVTKAAVNTDRPAHDRERLRGDGHRPEVPAAGRSARESRDRVDHG